MVKLSKKEGWIMKNKKIISTALILSLLSFPVLAFGDNVKYSKRDTIPKKYTWSVEDIYSKDSLWEEDYKKLESCLPKVQDYKGSLKDEKSILEFFKLKESILRLKDKLSIYASLKKSEDNANAKYSAMADKADGVSAKVSEAFSFAEPEILALPEEKIKSFENSVELKDYSLYFDNLLRNKKHSLTSEGEKILALASNIASTPENIYTNYTEVDRVAEDIVGIDGKKIKMTSSTYEELRENANRDLRKKAFESEFKSYQKNINTLSSTLAGQVKINSFFAKARNYNGALEASLDSDNVKPDIYNNLIDTVGKDLNYLHKYVSLRKKALNIKDKVRLYDMYVPLAKNTNSKYIEYENAKKMVKEALNPLGKDYMNDLNNGLENRWVDVYENDNKTSGAYCDARYDTHPYVLLNYNGTLDAVSTLAHEMGHAMNSYYSNKTQPYAKSDYPIFTAEVASTTNEALMLDYMIKNAKTKEEKLYLISNYLELIRGTVYSQVMYAEFEKVIHEASEKGESLTSDYLNETWGNLMKKYYGSDFEVEDLAKVWWSRVPHFYYDFYVYKYATGLSAGIILSDKMVNKEKDAQKLYLEFLSAGGNDYPIEMLKKAGVDLSSTEPVSKSLEKFNQLLTQYEELLKK